MSNHPQIIPKSAPNHPQTIPKSFLDQNLVGTKGCQIWFPTLEFLQKNIFFKNDPTPLGTLKYPPEDQFEIFIIFFKKKKIIKILNY